MPVCRESRTPRKAGQLAEWPLLVPELLMSQTDALQLHLATVSAIWPNGRMGGPLDQGGSVCPTVYPFSGSLKQNAESTATQLQRLSFSVFCDFKRNCGSTNGGSCAACVKKSRRDCNSAPKA